jgi:hypothetical protein
MSKHYKTNRKREDRKSLKSCKLQHQDRRVQEYRPKTNIGRLLEFIKFLPKNSLKYMASMFADNRNDDNLLIWNGDNTFNVIVSFALHESVYMPSGHVNMSTGRDYYILPSKKKSLNNISQDVMLAYILPCLMFSPHMKTFALLNKRCYLIYKKFVK